MFKEKPRPDERRNDLQARLQNAETRLEALRGNAVNMASNEPDKLAGLSESAFHIEFEINALRAAIGQVEQESAEAEERERQKADRQQREATSRQLHLMGGMDLEKAIAPVPEVLQALLAAVEAAGQVLGTSGLPQLLRNLSVEIPEAVACFVAELRTRADQTLEGRAPPILPAPPVLTVIEEALPAATIAIFTLESLTWLDERGQRQGCGPFQIRGLPVKAAKIALGRNLAISPDSGRYKDARDRPENRLAASERRAEGL